MRIKSFFAVITTVLIIAMSISMSSCKKKKDYGWEWGGGGEDTVKVTEKPRFIWVDAAANFPDFANSKANITRDLTLAKNAGFTDIVVDVRPTNGNVLFKTTKADQVAWLGAWVPGGYSKIERTETWDYLQAFIEEGHKLGLKIHAGMNTMTGGHTTSLGSQGLLFSDNSKKEWATYLNTSSGITNVMDLSDGTKFFNPVRTEVQDYLCSIISDLAAYKDLDGIFLDRGRFDGFESDFSPYTKQKFEEYIGQKITNFPNDVCPAGTTVGKLPNPLPTHFKKWLEFRAKVIHDFMVKARTAAKNANPNIKFGVYVGGWYGSYYDVGVNWASPNFDTGSKYPTWASANYKNFGYADHMDQMLIGAYASPGKVNGSGEWTMEGFCKLAKDKIMGSCKMVAGGPDVGNWDSADNFSQEQENQAITNSVGACIDACDGYFLFDMIHLKKASQWQYAKAGIDKYLEAIKKK